MQNEFSIIPGFNQDPQSDGRNLAALFGDDDETDEHQTRNELDFRYNPSSVHESEPIIPKPQSRRYSGNGTSVISLGEAIPVDFAEYKIHTVYLSVVNGEVLRFDDVEDGSMLCSISFSSFRISTIGNAVAICLGNDEIHSRFIADSDLYTKLCAIISARHLIEPLIFSSGNDGEEEIQENSHVLFSQLSFCFANNELKPLPEEMTDSKHLKMKSKRFEDSFLKHFRGKRAGAKFIVAIDGTASCFEIKKVKTKSSPTSDIISITSDSSRQATPPPLITDSAQKDMNEEPIPRQILATVSTLQTRMSKMGGIQLLPVEIVQPKPQEKEIISEVVAEETTATAPEPPPRTSPPIPPPPSESTRKPIPLERKTSNFLETTAPTNHENIFEKRITELEAKVEKLLTLSSSSSTATNTSISAQFATIKYEFAMDLWAQISASTSIPADVKPEIKKIILAAAFQP